MNPYEKFVSTIAALMQEAALYPLGHFEPSTLVSAPAEAPRVLLFSPHPDDECLIGGLPLRLQRELKMRVINVAVTQGSNRERQEERYQELTRACQYLGFGLIQIGDRGLEGINLSTRTQQPEIWRQAVEQIVSILQEQQPTAIFCPHDRDGNTTHIGTHYLVFDALQQMATDFHCIMVETEYWQAMEDPNLMVESGVEDVISFITALSFHAGEVRRNPYHIRLPAWMIDNVRRGSERVGGQGSTSAGFTFATLYRLRRWQAGQLHEFLPEGRVMAIPDDLSEFFV
ncbi:PIG-L family deacetylase [Leptolyngbya sp. 'hensonii']|uniref:PIG-L deacetylase family protein n=1 Tax=Leptolyngbya sp. 'hensonii' TaxID=1922337 RepID=UPI00094F8E0E|nr:PIG-L family deacetylase [Leptolyngbya sp. 'hensonii']OLP18341.1 PIG-L family deacetylase [Leptolyngbya sp. 'hensonii']